MARKKDSAELKKAKSTFAGAQATYAKSLSELKSIYKAFFGKKGASMAESYAQEKAKELYGDDVKFTKAGKLSVSKEVRRNPAMLTATSEAVKEHSYGVTQAWIENVETKLSAKDVAKFSKDLASAPAVNYVNRRIDALRKAFGTEGPYLESIRDDLKFNGVELTALGRVKQGQSSTMALMKALAKTPTVEKTLEEAVRDLNSEKLDRNEVKEKVKTIVKNPNTMDTYARFVNVIHGTISSYDEVLKEFYNAMPGDETTAGYADWLDVYDSLSHPGKTLVDSDVEALIEKITKYFEGGL